jgi:hypothetical protein
MFYVRVGGKVCYRGRKRGNNICYLLLSRLRSYLRRCGGLVFLLKSSKPLCYAVYGRKVTILWFKEHIREKGGSPLLYVFCLNSVLGQQQCCKHQARQVEVFCDPNE